MRSTKLYQSLPLVFVASCTTLTDFENHHAYHESVRQVISIKHPPVYNNVHQHIHQSQHTRIINQPIPIRTSTTLVSEPIHMQSNLPHHSSSYNNPTNYKPVVDNSNRQPLQENLAIQEEQNLRQAILNSYKTHAAEEAHRQQEHNNAVHQQALRDQEQRDIQHAMAESLKTHAAEEARRQQEHNNAAHQQALRDQEQRDIQHAMAESLKTHAVEEAYRQ